MSKWLDINFILTFNHNFPNTLAMIVIEYIETVEDLFQLNEKIEAQFHNAIFNVNSGIYSTKTELISKLQNQYFILRNRVIYNYFRHFNCVNTPEGTAVFKSIQFIDKYKKILPPTATVLPYCQILPSYQETKLMTINDYINYESPEEILLRQNKNKFVGDNKDEYFRQLNKMKDAKILQYFTDLYPNDIDKAREEFQKYIKPPLAIDYNSLYPNLIMSPIKNG